MNTTPITTGLEVLEKLAENHSNGSSIGETMGMRLARASKGRVVLDVTPDGRHLNPLGAVHGGFAATCLDGAAALALYSTLDHDTPYATVDLNVKYLRPVRENETYQTEGWLVDRTRRLAICDTEIRDQAGTLYAKGTATMMVMDER